MNEIRNKGKMLTITGIAVIMLCIITKLLPLPDITGYSVLVGIAFFFIVEWIEKTPDPESGLRFNTFFEDLRKCGPLLWLILPLISCIGGTYLSTLLFGNEVIDHIIGRTDDLINFQNLLLMTGQFLIGALGEEIAFRGFFTGKGMKVMGFWPATLLSSAFFALAHLSSGNTAIVIYDLIGIFIDAIIYSLIYKKTGNCLVSTLSHFLINFVGAIFVFTFLI